MKRQISLYLFLVIILICSLDSLEGNWIAEQVQSEPAIWPHAGDHHAEEAVVPCAKASSILIRRLRWAPSIGSHTVAVLVIGVVIFNCPNAIMEITYLDKVCIIVLSNLYVIPMM